MNTKYLIGLIVAIAVIVIAFFVYSNVFKSQAEKTTADEQQSHEATQQEEYYTCPMHPSVRSDKPGACPVCGMALVKKTMQKVDDSTRRDADVKDVSGMQTVSLSPTQRVMADISVAKVLRKTVSKDVQAVGVISYAEPNYRHISMRFPGRLEKLYLSYTGQTVHKGDPVADIYSPEAISAQQEFLLSLDSYELAKQSEQTFSASSTEQMLEQSEHKLLQWGFTEEQISKLKETRKINSLVTIYSQVSGIVVKKSVDPQHYAVTGEDMFDVADLSTVWILLDVYEKDIRFVSRGQSARITTEAYPNEKFQGRVVFIDPVLNSETRTIRVRTEFENPHGKLKPNMFVNATIAIPKSNALVVPSTAILSTGKRTVVWVEVKENTFEPRDVVVGSTSEGFTVVLDGLDEGETVAETGGFLIDSESALTQPAAVDVHAGHVKKEGQ